MFLWTAGSFFAVLGAPRAARKIIMVTVHEIPLTVRNLHTTKIHLDDTERKELLRSKGVKVETVEKELRSVRRAV